jgi:hypothetical protein
MECMDFQNVHTDCLIELLFFFVFLKEKELQVAEDLFAMVGGGILSYGHFLRFFETDFNLVITHHRIFFPFFLFFSFSLFLLLLFPFFSSSLILLARTTIFLLTSSLQMKTWWCHSRTCELYLSKRN